VASPSYSLPHLGTPEPNPGYSQKFTQYPLRVPRAGGYEVPQGLYGQTPVPIQHATAQRQLEPGYPPVASMKASVPSRIDLDHPGFATPNSQPPTWAGFMMYDNDPGFNMGTYDADIAWTFDFAQADAMDLSFSNALTPSVGDTSDTSYNEGQPMPPAQYHLGQGYGSRALGPSLESIVEVDYEPPNDWLDRASRPASPKAPPVPRRYINATFWNSVADEALRQGSNMKPDAAVIWKQSGINHVIRQEQIAAMNISPATNGNNTELTETAFPPPMVLDYFIQLYFEHVHARFPVIHLPTFDVSKLSPLLLVVIALAGSGYSRANAGKFSTLFYDKARTSLLLHHEADAKYVSILTNQTRI